jgi:hypothetical protein
MDSPQPTRERHSKFPQNVVVFAEYVTLYVYSILANDTLVEITRQGFMT